MTLGQPSNEVNLLLDISMLYAFSAQPFNEVNLLFAQYKVSPTSLGQPFNEVNLLSLQ